MTDRPSLHPLAVAGRALAAVAAVFTVVLLSAFWRNPHVLPSYRNNLWLLAWVSRWGWPPLAAALGGWIVSAMAIQRLTSRPGQARRGLGWARLGLALSASSGGLALFGMLVIPALRPHEAAWKTQCLANVKNVAEAVSMYVADWERFPAAGHWTDVAHRYLRDRGSQVADGSLRCPDAAGDCAYAFNASLDRESLHAIIAADRLVALFESDRGRNAHGGKELLTDFPRHLGGDNLGFADGHAKWYVRSKSVEMVSRNQVRLDTKWPHEYEAEHDGHLLWQPKPKPAVGGE